MCVSHGKWLGVKYKSQISDTQLLLSGKRIFWVTKLRGVENIRNCWSKVVERKKPHVKSQWLTRRRRPESPKGSPASLCISLGGPSTAPPTWWRLSVSAGHLPCSQEFSREFSTQERGLPVSLALHICAARLPLGVCVKPTSASVDPPTTHS